jgi:hypothetical protein
LLFRANHLLFRAVLGFGIRYPVVVTRARLSRISLSSRVAVLIPSGLIYRFLTGHCVQALAYLSFEDERERREAMRRLKLDEACRIAVNIA